MKEWLGFAAIAGLGFGVGFFCGERFGKKKEKDEQRLIREETEKNHRERLKLSHHEDTHAGQAFQEAAEAMKEYSGEDPDQHLKEMDAYLSQFESPTDDERDEEDEDLRPPKPKPERDYIHVVGEDVWESNTEYSPVELRYFEQDEVFVDESDDRVEDPEEHIGQEAIDQLKQFTDLEIQFALNTWTMEIYKITRVHDAYARAILGMDEDMEFYDPKG